MEGMEWIVETQAPELPDEDLHAQQGNTTNCHPLFQNQPLNEVESEGFDKGARSWPVSGKLQNTSDNLIAFVAQTNSSVN